MKKDKIIEVKPVVKAEPEIFQYKVQYTESDAGGKDEAKYDMNKLASGEKDKK